MRTLTVTSVELHRHVTRWSFAEQPDGRAGTLDLFWHPTTRAAALEHLALALLFASPGEPPQSDTPGIPPQMGRIELPVVRAAEPPGEEPEHGGHATLGLWRDPLDLALLQISQIPLTATLCAHPDRFPAFAGGTAGGLQVASTAWRWAEGPQASARAAVATALLVAADLGADCLVFPGVGEGTGVAAVQERLARDGGRLSIRQPFEDEPLGGLLPALAHRCGPERVWEMLWQRHRFDPEAWGRLAAAARASLPPAPARVADASALAGVAA